MGGHFAMNICEHADLLQISGDFSGQLLVTSLEAKQSLYEVDLTGKIGLVVGNEGSGVSPELLANVARHIKIPMPGKVESLNVASAAAVCLFEAARQRGL